jgi:hypothetical protein
MIFEYIPLVELWSFIHERLKGNISCDLYDKVDDEAGYPYCVFGEEVVVPEHTKQATLYRIETFLHIYSNQKGRKQTILIVNEILKLLTHRNDVFGHTFSGVENHGIKVSGLSDSGFSSTSVVDTNTNKVYRQGILGIEWLIY